MPSGSMKMYLAAVLPRLPETGVQPKGFIQEREPAARRACRRQLESLTEHCALNRGLWPAISFHKIEVRCREHAQARYIERAVESPTAQK